MLNGEEGWNSHVMIGQSFDGISYGGQLAAGVQSISKYCSRR